MSNPTEKMWVITAEQIQKIKGELGPMPYDKVERTLEIFSKLKPLEDYLPVETVKAPVKEPTEEKKIMTLKKDS